MMTDDEFEAETVARARAGDRDAAFEALRLCSMALRFRRISPLLADYLADRVDGIDTAIAESEQLREVGKDSSVNSAFASATRDALLINRGRGRPPAPLPDWHLPYAAFGALLLLAKVPVAKVKAAMADQRNKREGPDKSIDPDTATRILETHEALLKLDRDLLLHLADGLGDKLGEYLPATRKR